MYTYKSPPLKRASCHLAPHWFQWNCPKSTRYSCQPLRSAFTPLYAAPWALKPARWSKKTRTAETPKNTLPGNAGAAATGGAGRHGRLRPRPAAGARGQRRGAGAAPGSPNPHSLTAPSWREPQKREPWHCTSNVCGSFIAILQPIDHLVGARGNFLLLK